MALNERQKRLYTHKCDLYMPVKADNLPGSLEGQDLSYPPKPTYTNVACYFDSTPEVDVPTKEGRGKELNIFTLDQFRFDVAQPIEDTWALHFHAPGHPDDGGWWIIQGNKVSKTGAGLRQPNYAMVFGKKGSRPTGAA